MILSAILALLVLVQAPGAGPERFFVGRTEGAGTVHVMVAGRHGVRVRTNGRIDSSGALILDQIVEEEGKSARRRTWRLLRAGNRITGTISDVRGAVAGEVSGNRLHLRYRMADGPSVEQWIILHPNGRTAANRMIFRRFGLNVATVEETIRRVD